MSASRYVLCHQTPVNDASLQMYETQYSDYSGSFSRIVEENGSIPRSSEDQGFDDSGTVIQELAPYNKQPSHTREDVRHVSPRENNNSKSNNIQCQETAVFTWDQGPYTNTKSSSTVRYTHSPQTVDAQVHALQQNSQPHPNSSNLPKTTSVVYDTQYQNDVIRNEESAEGDCYASRFEGDSSNSSSLPNGTNGITDYKHYSCFHFYLQGTLNIS